MLEKDFSAVLEAISQDETLRRFKDHYAEVLDALRSSHKKELELGHRCDELNDAMVDNASKIKAALVIAGEDSQQISQLKTELSVARDLLMEHDARDQEARRRLERLGKLWGNLQQLSRENTALRSESLRRFNFLCEQVKAAQLRRGAQEGRSETAQREAAELRQSIDAERALLAQARAGLGDAEKLSEEVERHHARNAAKIQALREGKAELEAANAEEKGALAEEVAGQERQRMRLHELNLALGRAEAENVGRVEALQHLRGQQEQKQALYAHLRGEAAAWLRRKEEAEERLKAAEAETFSLTVKREQQLRWREKARFEASRAAGELAAAKRQQQESEEVVAQLVQKMGGLRGAAAEQLEQMASLRAQADGIRGHHDRSHADRQQSFDAMERLRAHNTAAEAERNALSAEAARLDAEIARHRQSRELLQRAIGDASAQICALREDAIAQEALRMDWEKKHAEAEEALAARRSLYEAACNERSAYARNLGATQDEVTELRRRMQTAGRQAEQLQAEFEARRAALEQEVQTAKINDRAVQTLQKTHKGIEARVEQEETALKVLTNEVSKLQTLKGSIDGDLDRTEKTHHRAVCERDLFGTTLIQKNDELALLLEQISSQEGALSGLRGRQAQAEQDVSALGAMRQDLGRELRTKLRAAARAGEYQQQVARLTQSLLEERVRVKALGEEAESPQNVARWREVGADQPDCHELLDKAQAIQRRLLAKTQAVIAQEVRLAFHAQTADNLREVIQNNPGAAEASRLLALQRALQRKTHRLKARAAELNLYRFTLAEREAQVADLREELSSLEARRPSTVPA